jgi:DNA-binding response OmpR family regulator
MEYRPVARRQGIVRRTAKAEAVMPYGSRTRGIPSYPVAARRADGSLLTLSDLPDPRERWTRRRKHTVLECIDHGLLSPEVAQRRYRLNEGELGEWRATQASGGRVPITCTARPRLVTSGVVNRGPLAIDLDAMEVQVGGELVALTGSEWTVLAAIAEAYGEIVTTPMIMGALYGEPARAAGVKIVDVLVWRLRRKLGVAADLLDVIWGRGYFLVD